MEIEIVQQKEKLSYFNDFQKRNKRTNFVFFLLLLFGGTHDNGTPQHKTLGLWLFGFEIRRIKIMIDGIVLLLVTRG